MMKKNSIGQLEGASENMPYGVGVSLKIRVV